MDSLDLHGIRHDEVSRVLETFLYEEMQKASKECEIITGMSSRMKEIVGEIVKEHGMKSTIKWGNNGILVVTM